MSAERKPLGVVMWHVESQWSHKPKPIVVVKQTSATVWVEATWLDRQSVTRRMSNAGVFRTFEEAKAHIVDRCAARLDMIEKGLVRAREELAAAEALVEPQ